MSTHAETSDTEPTAILAALSEAIPGFTLEERDLALFVARRPKGAHDLRADWVGTDRSGRLVLASVKETGDDEAILWAVESVAFVSKVHLGAGARSVRTKSKAAGDGPVPHVVLIVRTCSARLLSALSLLPAGSFSLLEVQDRRGTGDTKLSLVRRDLRVEGGSSRLVEQGIEAWPADARQLAESLAARMRRIDPAIERTESPQGLQFLFRDEEAARLSLQGGKLVGACGGASEAATIDDDSEADVWLERTLRMHAVRLRSGHRPTRPADLLSRSGPLPSPEELAAFRDD
jgi:hypothetical protein